MNILFVDLMAKIMFVAGITVIIGGVIYVARCLALPSDKTLSILAAVSMLLIVVPIALLAFRFGINTRSELTIIVATLVSGGLAYLIDYIFNLILYLIKEFRKEHKDETRKIFRAKAAAKNFIEDVKNAENGFYTIDKKGHLHTI